MRPVAGRLRTVLIGVEVSLSVSGQTEPKPRMMTATINIKGLVFLVADANPCFSRIVVGLLRSFGATAVTEVRNSFDAIQMLNSQKIDILLCDDKLPPHGGLQVTHAIRRKRDNENRTIPILIMSGETRESLVKIARDAGANMVLAKPVSASSLYDRLAWIAFTPRQFVDTPSYYGPDRRFKNEPYSGVGRRKTDRPADAAGTAPTAPMQPAQGDNAVPASPTLMGPS
jgi:CheY-like chemotaxis protein